MKYCYHLFRLYHGKKHFSKTLLKVLGVGRIVTMLKPSHLAGDEEQPVRAVANIPRLCPKLRSKRPSTLRVGMDMADPLALLQGNQHARIPL